MKLPTKPKDDSPARGQFAAETYRQSFSVSFDYPVIFTRDVFNPANPLLADVLDRKREGRRHRAVVYVDNGLAGANPRLLHEIKEYFHAWPDKLELAGGPTVIPGGPAAKTDYELLRDAMWTLGNLHLDRQSFVIALGGGNMLDALGLAVSLVHRGLRMVRLPSTVLGQNDAGVGVKNGMDEHGQKNFIGSFSPPFAVVNDFNFLRTLKDEDWIGGIAEAFKVAIIKDAAFFDFLRQNAAALRQRQQPLMEELIRRCATIHLDHIREAGDPFEFGSARPLDFGHWAAHKIEILSSHRVGHGQAVAVGIALDSYYAMRKGLIGQGDFDRIIEAMTASGLPVWVDYLGLRNSGGELEILDGLKQFQEHLGGQLNVTLPDGIGGKVEVHQMNIDLLEDGIAVLGKLAGRTSTTSS
ncbi:MAG: 3-dehydroquinate synthase [Phycisphaerae bacterium]|nr:3-dehydroquinate synthase [Phycisphaerae bacterium]